MTLCRKLATLVAPWLEEELGGLECVNITQRVICFDKYGTRAGNFLPVGLSRFFSFVLATLGSFLTVDLLKVVSDGTVLFNCVSYE